MAGPKSAALKSFLFIFGRFRSWPGDGTMVSSPSGLQVIHKIDPIRSHSRKQTGFLFIHQAIAAPGVAPAGSRAERNAAFVCASLFLLDDAVRRGRA
jgi:hypothetical protein